MKKPKLTVNQSVLIEDLKQQALYLGYEENGDRTYYFDGGAKADGRTVESLLKRGVIKFEQTPLGDGQRILAA